MNEPRIPLSAQASACDVMLRILSGGLKPSRSERALLANRLKAASDSLRFIELHDMEFHDFVRRKSEGKVP